MSFRGYPYGSDDAIDLGEQSNAAAHHRNQYREVRHSSWAQFLDRDLAAQHIDPALRSSNTSTHVLPPGAMELLRGWEQEHKEVVDSMPQTNPNIPAWTEPSYHRGILKQLPSTVNTTDAKITMRPLNPKEEPIKSVLVNHTAEPPTAPYSNIENPPLAITLTTGGTVFLKEALVAEVLRGVREAQRAGRIGSITAELNNLWATLSPLDKNLVMQAVMRTALDLPPATSMLNHDWLEVTVSMVNAAGFGRRIT